MTITHECVFFLHVKSNSIEQTSIVVQCMLTLLEVFMNYAFLHTALPLISSSKVLNEHV